ncbi:unnamed protein product [Brassica napus]|uniref:(rape) hypothetical protein n=1 Tax=Brassica napus TaxID=3708 RepID=A0A816VES2_BRANA|nr:unnamed protein product [Brassica napus]
MIETGYVDTFPLRQLIPRCNKLPSSLEDAIENVISLQMQIHAELKDSSFTYIIVTPTAFFKSLGGQVEIACSEMVSCALVNPPASRI